jgi:transketolase
MAKSIREAYGEALAKYGKDNDKVVVLDADVSSSTKSNIFAAACPERFFNVGIAEANMAAMAAGFASAGKVPFVNTFASFITSLSLISARAFGSYSRLGIKFAGAYSGLSDAFDGPSHHSIDDLAVMRALPNFKVFVASDERLTDWLVKNAIEDPSPMYIRLSRDVFPSLYKEDDIFEDGKGKILKDGKDVVIVSCGIMTGKALEAARMLAEKGIDAAVIDMFCIKPLDSALLLDYAKKTGAVVTAEEHSIIGGLGAAVAQTLCSENVSVPVGFVGINDRHAECGPYSDLLHHYGLDADAVAVKAIETVSKKQIK